MADALSRYRAKRNFKETPEPRGMIKRAKGRLFVVQKHDATRLHYDFRLELDGVLLSWAVTRGPSLNPADKRLAVRVEDHPVAYGGFEGVIPSGYGAGTVMLWDRGEWAPRDDPHEGLKEGHLKFVLAGERLKGGFALVRMKPRPGEKSKRENWLLIKERDRWADESAVATEKWDTSIKTGRDLDEITTEGEAYERGKAYSALSAGGSRKAAKRKTSNKEAAKTSRAKKSQPKSGARRRAPLVAPRFVAPQLAVLEASPPSGRGWLHEMKFDGYRITPRDVRRDVVWVSPELVAQIAYFETTPDGHLRHPSYLGLREDKPAKAVKAATSSTSLARSKPAASARTVVQKITSAKRSGSARLGGLRLTSPDKLLWPDAGVTKLDLANYYRELADRLLVHVKDRPLSLVRCPEGYEGECFFQKHRNPSTPKEIDTIGIREKGGGRKDYLVIRNAAGIVSAAQIGALELHVWGARIDNLEKPERVVFDLDPDEDLGFGAVKRAAVELRDVLASLGLKSWPLLTGGKGVHVVAPIARTREWPEVKAFASGLARQVAASAPDRYIAQASKAKRQGKVFIDWLRNERGATAIAPFSPRRRPGAPVATPVSWEELRSVDTAAAYTMRSIVGRLERLTTDPWKGYTNARQSLKAAAISSVA